MNPIAIPREKALQLCTEIRKENRRKRYTPAVMMCWGCLTFSKMDPAKLCFNSRPDHRGCYPVNARYDREVKSGAAHEDTGGVRS